MKGVVGSRPTCDRPDCDRLAVAHGICRTHYERERHRHRTPTPARILRRRARQRATAALIKRHANEFKALLEEFTSVAIAENELLRGEVAAAVPVETRTPEVVLLRPGPRPYDEDPIDRVDTAPVRPMRCGGCGEFHANGHECPSCALRPAMASAPDVVRLIYRNNPDACSEPFVTNGSEPCAQTDREEWFPEKGGSTRAAKAACHTCPREVECLLSALQRGERHGIWGGQSERERRALAKELGIKTVDLRDIDREEARRMYERDLPVEEIASHLGVSERTVHRWLAIGESEVAS